MSQTITLQNKFLTAEISTLGAELLSVRDAKGTEYIWEGDPAVWAGHAPVVFPICGGLKNDTYTLNGKTYTQQKHGFARFEEFTPIRVGKNEAVFSLRENERTFPTFPYQFAFLIAYVLDGNCVRVTYTVHNMSRETMYFSVGGHEAYALPDGIENYDLYFDQEEDLRTTVLDGNLFKRGETEPVMQGRVLPMKSDYFSVDALCFAQLNSRAVTLIRRGGGRTVRVAFEGFDHLLLWQKCGAKYLCIEPWTGLPDYNDADGEIAHKDSITALAAGETFSRTHVIVLSDK